jgi:hypothetical protein
MKMKSRSLSEHGKHGAMMLRLLLAIALTMTAPASPAQEKVNLGFKYRQGGIYRYRTTDTFHSLQEEDEKEMKFDGGNNILMSLEVISVAPDSTITFIITYEEVEAFVRSEMLDTVIDRKGLRGRQTKIAVNKLGKEISRELMDSVDDSGDEISLDMASGNYGNFFYLPGHPVAAREKWIAEIHDSVATGKGYRTQTGSVEYAISETREKKNGHDCIKIDFSAMTEHARKMELNGMDGFMEGTVDARGVIWFDAEAGILILRESTEILEMIFVITGPMTMSIPVTQKIKSSCWLVEN